MTDLSQSQHCYTLIVPRLGGGTEKRLAVVCGKAHGHFYLRAWLDHAGRWTGPLTRTAHEQWVQGDWEGPLPPNLPRDLHRLQRELGSGNLSFKPLTIGYLLELETGKEPEMSAAPTIVPVPVAAPAAAPVAAAPPAPERRKPGRRSNAEKAAAAAAQAAADPSAQPTLPTTGAAYVAEAPAVLKAATNGASSPTTRTGYVCHVIRQSPGPEICIPKLFVVGIPADLANAEPWRVQQTVMAHFEFSESGIAWANHEIRFGVKDAPIDVQRAWRNESVRRVDWRDLVTDELPD